MAVNALGQFHVTMDMVQKNKTFFSAHFVIVYPCRHIMRRGFKRIISIPLDWNELAHLEQLCDNFIFFSLKTLYWSGLCYNYALICMGHYITYVVTLDIDN